MVKENSNIFYSTPPCLWTYSGRCAKKDLLYEPFLSMMKNFDIPIQASRSGSIPLSEKNVIQILFDTKKLTPGFYPFKNFIRISKTGCERCLFKNLVIKNKLG
ncbi:MAG TPA: hypothetical protein VI819_02215 [Patescibacteria group bacterium]|nr:hypothetical protein [Patescibacteria group bacterium]